MPWHLKSEGGQVLVVRDRDQKVVGRHKDRKKATAQLRVLYSLEKAQFRSFIEKASFGGDRSAAGRYAAQQRWKNHKKDATKPAVRERRMAEKFQEGPILKNGFDSMGFPKLLTPAEAKERFGETVTMQKAYFAGRGMDLFVDAQYSDGESKIDTESPAYFASLQALDDVLDQVDITKLKVDPKNGLIPYVGISNFYQSSKDGTGGYFDSSRNDVALFMSVSKLVEESYANGQRLSVGTVPQMAADVIQGSSFAKNDSVAARIAYGFTVHEMGHWIDYALGITDNGFQEYRSQRIVDRTHKDPQLASDDEQRFSDFSDRSFDPRGTSYSNTNYAERFAENFTAWFTMTRVNVSTINQLKSDLASRGGLVAVGAALEVLKQGRIVDNLFDWPPDHPVFLFAFRGEPFDVDALKQQVLVGMIKASFGGDRSAAGRYAAEQRWKGHAKVDEPRDYQNISLVEYEKLLSVTSQKEKSVNSSIARKAYGVWGTSSFVQINETLRGHEIDEDSWIPESFSAEEAAQALKENFDEFAVELPKDATVFRGVAYESEVEFIEEGMIFTDKGLISTSTTFEFARSFGDGSELDLVFDIQIPKGTKVWAPKTPFVKQETEITLKPGTRFKVKQVYDESDDYGDVRRVVMEVIND